MSKPKHNPTIEDIAQWEWKALISQRRIENLEYIKYLQDEINDLPECMRDNIQEGLNGLKEYMSIQRRLLALLLRSEHSKVLIYKTAWKNTDKALANLIADLRKTQS